MKTSRERNILIAVLSLAGLGLMIDRAVIGSDVTGPAESSAGVMDSLTPDPASLLIAPDQADHATRANATAQPAESLAQRLRQIADAPSSSPDDTLAVRDAFQPAPSWAAPDPGPDGGDTAALAAEAFKRDHKLDAVLVTGDRRYAVVNGRTIYVGQTVQGYRLLAVRERSAEFQADGVHVSLSILGADPSP